jgi:hypothetical protein
MQIECFSDSMIGLVGMACANQQRNIEHELGQHQYSKEKSTEIDEWQ